MESLKIVIDKDKEKSIEAKSIFGRLGYYESNTLHNKFYGWIVSVNDCEYTDDKDYFNKHHAKLVTLDQLKDMVVLKRNDAGDATHINLRTNTPFLVQDYKEYFYLNNKWILSDSVNDLKPIEKREMKEFLVNHGNKWTLQLLDSDTEENSFRVAVPSGDDVAYMDNDNGEIYFTKLEMGYRDVDLIWQRSEDFTKVTIDDLKHRVYKKDVSHLDSIDVYRVLGLFNVKSHAVGHAIKKLLCSGGRGSKDEAQDIQEAIDSLVRYQEMKNEDE